MSPFRERNRGFTAPKPESPIGRYRAEAALNAQRPGYTDATHVLHATVPSGPGPARKHTAKFEPAAWRTLGPNDERSRCPKTRFE